MANETYRWKGAIEPRSEQYTGQTNFIEYSSSDPEDFTTWFTQNSTTAATTELAPWGEEHVTKFSDDGVGSTSKDVRIEARTMDIGEEDSHIFSVYAKEDQTGVLELRATGFDTTQLTRFDITDQTTGNSSADEFGIEDVGDGWYRCWIRFSTVSDTVGDVYIHLNDTKTTPTCTTDGTHSVFLAGAKVERNHLSPYKKLPETIQPNLLKTSSDSPEDFSTWTLFSLTHTAATETNPAGGATSSKLADDGSTGLGTVIAQAVPITVEAGSNVASVYLKEDQSEFVELRVSGFDALKLTRFDLANQTIGTDTADASGIEDWGNGWYRCWIEFSTTTDLTGDFRVYVTDSATTANCTKDGTHSVFAWGMKVEADELTAYTPLNATYRWKGAQEPQAAEAATGVTVEVAQEAITVTTYAAEVLAGTVVDAAQESITVTTYQADVSTGVEIDAEQEAITVTTYPAEVLVGVTVEANSESVSVATYQAEVVVGTTVEVNTESISLTTYPASIQSPTVVNVGVVEISMSTYPVFDDGMTRGGGMEIGWSRDPRSPKRMTDEEEVLEIAEMFVEHILQR